jgi:serine protease
MMFAVNGALTPAQVTAGLKSSARAHPANTYCTASANVGKCGAGLLDADGALVAAANPAATATPAPAPVASDSGGGGGGGGAIAPWSAVVLLGIGVVGFGMRRRVR